MTQEDSQSVLMDKYVQIMRLVCSEVRILRLGDDEEPEWAKLMISRWREKLLNMFECARTANRHR